MCFLLSSINITAKYFSDKLCHGKKWKIPSEILPLLPFEERVRKIYVVDLIFCLRFDLMEAIMR